MRDLRPRRARGDAESDGRYIGARQLNEGLTVLDLKPGNAVTLARLREVIRNNGYVSREAKIVAAGTAITSGNDLAFEITGTRERFLVLADSNEQRQRADDLRAKAKTAAAAPVLITGVVHIADPKSMTLRISLVGQR